MTARDLIALFLKRWYLMMLGAMVTLGAMYFVLHQPGVYWTKLTIVLLAPVEKYYPNKVQDPHYQLAPMAGVVVTRWNDELRPTLTASGDTTIFGEGVHQGVLIRMPNQGSQWNPQYLSPNIDVQVVGGSPAAVEAKAIKVSSELGDILKREQDDLGINSKARITLVRTPDVPTVFYINGSRSRALLATGLSGALATSAAVYWLERWKPGWRLASSRRWRAEPPSSNLSDEPTRRIESATRL